MIEKIRPFRQSDTSTQFIGKTSEEAKKVQSIHTDRIMENPLIRGFGIGMETNEELNSRCIVFRAYLRQEPTQEEKGKLAEELEGIPVRYEVTGEFVAS